MISKYAIFCKLVEIGNFTRTADKLGYSQSAVSQAVKSLEQELNLTLISRNKGGIVLTSDGERIYPYIAAINNAERALETMQQEMHSLENSSIRIGTFTSVSRNLLPQMMKLFKERYPGIQFILRQGEYTSIRDWLKEGSIDLGFLNSDIYNDLEMEPLYKDDMRAIVPEDHPLAEMEEVSMRQLAKEPFILLDEGEFSLPMKLFNEYKLEPRIEYHVYDDYSILAMIRQGLGVSMLYHTVLAGLSDDGVKEIPVREKPLRTIALAWNSYDTMPLAAKRFSEFVIRQCRELYK
ncbi:MAG: LysR family transcriptional regulator [Lachnospiraceae bacterium]